MSADGSGGPVTSRLLGAFLRSRGERQGGPAQRPPRALRPGTGPVWRSPAPRCQRPGPITRGSGFRVVRGADYLGSQARATEGRPGRRHATGYLVGAYPGQVPAISGLARAAAGSGSARWPSAPPSAAGFSPSQVGSRGHGDVVTARWPQGPCPVRQSLSRRRQPVSTKC
jgi:hypothetical protein